MVTCQQWWQSSLMLLSYVESCVPHSLPAQPLFPHPPGYTGHISRECPKLSSFRKGVNSSPGSDRFFSGPHFGQLVSIGRDQDTDPQWHQQPLCLRGYLQLLGTSTQVKLDRWLSQRREFQNELLRGRVGFIQIFRFLSVRVKRSKVPGEGTWVWASLRVTLCCVYTIVTQTITFKGLFRKLTETPEGFCWFSMHTSIYFLSDIIIIF